MALAGYGGWSRRLSAFARYGLIARDQCVPIKELYVAIANDKGRVSFETLMAMNGVPGSVNHVPEVTVSLSAHPWKETY
ncbi:hypothetical protein DDE18_06115 [Nocardioides gansuensis]|uniref:Uncharacterized protein n=1 Tax=Nocardioides gansuensis TaxID=2138300 RepID=A0A2T8FDT3_9ACTN|nr:hypothetical protein DDE18_06115 [Nocardioides gansuensis]